MDASKIIKQILIEKGLRNSDLAELLGIQPQAVRNKLYRNSYTLKEFAKIMELLDCEIIIQTKDGKVFK